MKHGPITSDAQPKASIEAEGPHSGIGPRAFDVLAVTIVFVAYAATLGVANGLTLFGAMRASIANTIPVIIFGLPARWLLVHRLIGRRTAVQAIGHIALATGYALCAYWLTTVLLGLVHGNSPTEFTVEPFIRRAFAWQLLENYTTYGVIAAIAYVRGGSQPVAVILSASSDPNGQSDKGLGRYFIRSGEGLRPIDVNRIVSITGADDYAEVATLDGCHLVRMTLAEFDRALDPVKFVRVHRSRIVNINHLERAEPAGGGRMLLYLANGEMVSTSRAGARLLRDLVL
jgi:two-component system, LytTR family, response regulator